MSAPQPPRLANWLLRRFASGPKRESLVGDLDEQFARGRSAFWYRRQVLSAILVGVASDVRDHKLFALQSVMIMLAIVVPWVESTWALYLRVSEKWVNAWVNSSDVLFELWIPFGGGLCLIWCVGSATSGWVNARLGGNHRSAMVVATALAQIPLSLWWSAPVWLHAGMISRVGPKLWVPNYIWAVVVLVGMPVCTLLGALLRADSDDAQQPDVQFSH
jgi:hypothetical protein